MLCAPSLGSPLSAGEQLRFKGRKKGQTLTGTAVVIQFSKYFPAKWAQAATATVDDEMMITYSDLLHSVVSLYDNCLPQLSPQAIFHQICHDGARTLVVLRDSEESLRDVLNCKGSEFNNNPVPSGSKKPWQKIVPSPSGGSDGAVSLGGVSSPEEEGPSTADIGAGSNGPISPVDNRQWVSWASMNRRNKEEIMAECGSVCSENPYSDMCSNDSSDDSESIEEDEAETTEGHLFSRSLDAYLKAVQQRKRDRHMGVESRLVACATFSKDYRPSGAKVVSLSHIAVRRKFRRYGIGSFLLKRVKSPSLVGPYDAITIHVRNDVDPNTGQSQKTVTSTSKQVAFFQKNNFCNDIILNSRFRDNEQNNNATCRSSDILMCYLPPFDGHYQTNLSANSASHQQTNTVHAIRAMQEEAQKWKEKSLEAYQVQMSYMARLQQEVLRLHELLQKQDSTIDVLRKENSRLQTRLLKAEKKSAKALIETLDREAADFERMCIARKISSAASVL